MGCRLWRLKQGGRVAKTSPYSAPLMIPVSTRAARSSLASVITVARSVAAAWLAFARWAVGVAPWHPTMADALAPTVISQEQAPREGVPGIQETSRACWLGLKRSD